MSAQSLMMDDGHVNPSFSQLFSRLVSFVGHDLKSTTIFCARAGGSRDTEISSPTKETLLRGVVSRAKARITL